MFVKIISYSSTSPEQPAYAKARVALSRHGEAGDDHARISQLAHPTLRLEVRSGRGQARLNAKGHAGGRQVMRRSR